VFFVVKVAHCVIIVSAIKSLINIFSGNIINPIAFSITATWGVLFFISKVSMFRRKIWVSFGTKGMPECMENCYRIGYWLIIAGIIMTFS